MKAKRLLTLALCLVMLMAVMAVTAFAEPETTAPTAKCDLADAESQLPCILSRTGTDPSSDGCGWACANHVKSEHGVIRNGLYLQPHTDVQVGQSCQYCGWTRQPTHQHTYDNNVVAYNDENHWIKCDSETCNEVKAGSTAAHTWDDYGKCTGCEKRNHTHSFAETWSQEVAAGVASHYHACTFDGCKEKADSANCTSDGESHMNDEYHWNECTVCAGEMNKTQHSKSGWESDDDETHSMTCSGCDWSDTKDHVFADAAGSLIDCFCGAQNPHHGEYKSVWDSNSEYHWFSCVVSGCTEHKKDYAEHDYVGVTCRACGMFDPNGAVSYAMLDAPTKWYADSSKGASFRSSAHIADYIRAEIDGTILTSGYTVTEGSTIVTLSPELLKSLPLGRHIMSIVSRNRNNEAVSASAAFEILESEGYTVTFKMNGHGHRIHPQTVEAGDRAERPHDPKEKGYIFCGWYTDRHLHHKFDFRTPIEEDTVLYAKWILASPVPKTGDNSNITLWAAVLAAGLAVTGAAILPRKKNSI